MEEPLAATPETVPEPAAAPIAEAAPEQLAGVAGGSARREYERRAARREAEVRGAHPRIGGLILALTDEPQSTRAWGVGARGEEMLGKGLDSLAPRGSGSCTTGGCLRGAATSTISPSPRRGCS